MKIDRIGYGATINTGNYENIKVYLEAEVEEWEDPIESVKVLMHKVSSFAHKKEEATNYEERVATAKNKVRNLNYKIEKAKTVWEQIIGAKEKAVETLKSLGVDEEKLSVINYRFPDTPDFRQIKTDDDTYNDDDDDDDDDDIPM